MANITITIPDAQVQRVQDAFVGRFTTQFPTPGGEPSTETPAALVKRALLDYVKQTVREWEQQQAAQASADEIRQGVENDFSA